MIRLAKSDYMRGTLAMLLMTAFCAMLVALFLAQIPESNKETLTYAAGQLSGMVTTALAFYFSTTQGSEQKTHMLMDRSPTGTPTDPISTEEIGKG